MKDERGSFIVVEGPSGVGKSSVIAAARVQIEEKFGTRVHVAKQPSASRLGQLTRDLIDQLSPESLACLVAADRYQQLATDIRPRLSAGQTVLCDRYTPSSLVLQVFDGVDEQLVRGVNSHADPPDLCVFLMGDPLVSRGRSHNRGPRDRFHRQLKPDAEARRYRQVASDLRAEGQPVLELATDGRSIDAIASELVGLHLSWL